MKSFLFLLLLTFALSPCRADDCTNFAEQQCVDITTREQSQCGDSQMCYAPGDCFWCATSVNDSHVGYCVFFDVCEGIQNQTAACPGGTFSDSRAYTCSSREIVRYVIFIFLSIFPSVAGTFAFMKHDRDKFVLATVGFVLWGIFIILFCLVKTILVWVSLCLFMIAAGFVRFCLRHSRYDNNDYFAL